MSATAEGRVIAVVVNWNGGETNELCLASLFAGGLQNDTVIYGSLAATAGLGSLICLVLCLLNRKANGGALS